MHRDPQHTDYRDLPHKLLLHTSFFIHPLKPQNWAAVFGWLTLYHLTQYFCSVHSLHLPIKRKLSICPSLLNNCLYIIYP